MKDIHKKIDDMMFALYSDFMEAVDESLKTGKTLRETEKGAAVEALLATPPQDGK